MSAPDFSNILTKLSPHLLIYDMFQPWAPELALLHNIPAVLFLVAAAISYQSSYTDQSALLRGGGHQISSSEFEEVRLEMLARSMKCIGLSSNMILLKSSTEVEPKHIESLAAVFPKKIVPVGLLVQNPNEETEDAQVEEWLDKKNPSSVVFVSFGSECYLSKEEREELAHGLMLSEVDFIWVLQFPKGEEISVKEALPEGLEFRGRGLVVEGWGPQKRVLGHPSVGGFLSHCGWSSVTESMSFGVPIMAMPMHLDQPINAKLVAEVGVGLQIERDKDGIYRREEVAKAIKEVVLEKSGEIIRSRAREMKDRIREGGDGEIDELIGELLQLLGGQTQTN